MSTFEQAIARALQAPEVVAAISRQLAAQVGGVDVYIPKRGGREALLERNKRIREQFRGNNLSELSKANQLTPRQVRNILARDK